MSRVHLFSLSFTAFIKPDNGIFFSHCMLKLPALATESSNSFSCQKHVSLYLPQLRHSLTGKLYHRPKAERASRGLQGKVMESKRGRERDFISASYFKNSRKPPRCQPIPPCFYEEQDKHLQSRVILFGSEQKSWAFTGLLLVSWTQHEVALRAHKVSFHVQIRKPTAETSLHRIPHLPHPGCSQK